MIVGATIDPRVYDSRVPTYPESQMCRVFGYPSTGLPSWRGRAGDRRIPTLRQMVPNMVPACVFQDWPSDSEVRERLTAWLDEVDGPARLTWRHEADRKTEEPAQYRRRYFLMAELLAEHPAAELVTLVPTSTYQWTQSMGPGKGRGDFSKFHVGVGVAGVDVYADSWREHYPDPAQFLAALWRYRDTIGSDIEIPEFGAARVAGDGDGQRRAEWFTRCAAIMAAEGVTAVSYWDDIGSNGTDLRLYRDSPDTPEVQAWRAVMREHNTLPGDIVDVPPVVG